MSEARRLHCAVLPAAVGAELDLDDTAARHARVLRLRVGDPVVLFDGRGDEADARVVQLDPSVVRCALVARRARRETGARVVLVQALAKGSKLEDIVRAATECGVTAIHLAIAERSIARPDETRAAAKLERLRAIAREAARQCERADVPEIVSPAPLLEVAARAPANASRVVLSARTGARWDEHLRDETWIVVGPEGGTSPDEERALGATGWTLARFALPVLRVETAAPVAVAMIRDRLASSR